MSCTSPRARAQSPRRRSAGARALPLALLLALLALPRGAGAGSHFPSLADLAEHPLQVPHTGSFYHCYIELAGHPKFREITGELRKRGVVLNVIDQRPSDLDPDVVSMLWTMFCFTLTNKRDLDVASLAVGPAYARVLPSLGRREALVAGEAVKFPVVVSVREYAEALEEAKRVAARGRGRVDASDFL